MITLNRVELEGKAVKELAREFKKFVKAQGVNAKILVTSEVRYWGDKINIKIKEDVTVDEIAIVSECARLFNQEVPYMESQGQFHYYNESEQAQEISRVKFEKQQAEMEVAREENERLYIENVKVNSIGEYEVINVEDEGVFINALIPSLNKNDWKSDNDKEINKKSRLGLFRVTDIVKLSKEDYNYFKFNLLTDYDFLSGKGGSQYSGDPYTDENAIFLNNKAVIVFAEGEELLVIDPSGYDYARYTCRLSEDINGSLKEFIDNNFNSSPTDPTPTKKIKRETIYTDTNENNNVIAVNFGQPSQPQTVNNKKDEEWKIEKATKKQLYALYCISKIKTNDLDISKGEASELISRAKSGEDIKEDIISLLGGEIKAKAVR